MMRRILAVILLAAVSLPLVSFGQVEVSLKFPSTAYLLYERAKAVVTIRNRTDQSLVIGGLDGFVLAMSVRNDKRRSLTKQTREQFASNVLVLPGKTSSVEVDVARHFPMHYVGEYHVRASVSIGETTFDSPTRVIDVVPGIDVKTLRRSVPGEPKKIRVFRLAYWDRDDSSHLFLSCTDTTGKMNYGVFDLGPILRVAAPEFTAGIYGKIHIRHQVDNATFVHSFFQSSKEGVMFLTRKVERLGETKGLKALLK